MSDEQLNGKYQFRLHSSVLYVTGLIILTFAIIIQVPASLNKLHQERINTWSVKIPLDMSQNKTYREVFSPLSITWHNLQLDMRGPVAGEFKSYQNGISTNVPSEVTQKFFSERNFAVSWRVLDGKKELMTGTFGPSDVNAWVYTDYVYYQARENRCLPRLKPGKEYSLIAQIEQANKGMNEFKPLLLIRTTGSFKARGVARLALQVSIPMFIIGFALLFCAILKHRLEKLKVSDTVSD